MSSNNRLRIAVLGARGIGRVHARIFHELGSQVCAVLGSTHSTATIAAQELKKSFGIKAKSFSNLNELLLQASPDAVSICTPPNLHLNQIMEILDRGLPVFCEKPLFWHKNITYKEVVAGIDRLAVHPRRRLFVNTSNASFIEAIRPRLPATDSIRSFSLKFYTWGLYKWKDIAYDLLPHGLSMLIQLLGKHKITQLKDKISENTYECKFYYSNYLVKFKFKGGGECIQKKLLFSINDHKFMRIQEEGSSVYRVSIKDCKTGEHIQVEDPFRIYISRFLDSCKTIRGYGRDTFDQTSNNMKLMAGILLNN